MLGHLTLARVREARFSLKPYHNKPEHYWRFGRGVCNFDGAARCFRPTELCTCMLSAVEGYLKGVINDGCIALLNSRREKFSAHAPISCLPCFHPSSTLRSALDADVIPFPCLSEEEHMSTGWVDVVVLFSRLTSRGRMGCSETAQNSTVLYVLHLKRLYCSTKLESLALLPEEN